MNNQATVNRGGRGGGRVKNPSKPPRFSRNSATQSQVPTLFNQITIYNQ
jgi:hypothetical protein